MKKIFKTKEPISLTNYRSSISKHDLNSLEKFDTAPSNVKDELRDKLLEEQGFICCYCTNRIGRRNSKVEHFKPRSLFRSQQLDYKNLFVACLGGQGFPSHKQFCDTKKGKEKLKDIDLLKNIQNNLKYNKRGLIFSDHSKIDEELNTILNLNYDVLKRNREDALNQVILELNQSSWGISDLKTTINKYQNKNSKGKYRPYCEMIVYFLTKKLRQKS